MKSGNWRTAVQLVGIACTALTVKPSKRPYVKKITAVSLISYAMSLTIMFLKKVRRFFETLSRLDDLEKENRECLIVLDHLLQANCEVANIFKATGERIGAVESALKELQDSSDGADGVRH